MGNPFTKEVGKVLTMIVGNVLTMVVGKVLDIYRFWVSNAQRLYKVLVLILTLAKLGLQFFGCANFLRSLYFSLHQKKAGLEIPKAPLHSFFREA